MVREQLTDEQWARLQPLLPPQKPRTGRPAHDHRRILEAIPTARHRLFNFGHFGHWDMPAAEFPELLEEILS